MRFNYKWKCNCALKGNDNFFLEDHLILSWQKSNYKRNWVEHSCTGTEYGLNTQIHLTLVLMNYTID